MLQITLPAGVDADLCPIRSVLVPVLGKWAILIVLSLEDGPLRFSEVKRAVGNITQRVLTQNLRLLERDGHLTRKVIPGPPVEVHYELTERGRDWLVLLKPLVFWAQDTFADVKNSRDAMDA